MFDQQTVAAAIALLAALSVGGIAYALVAPLLNNARADKRVKKVATMDTRMARAQATARQDANQRRKSIASKLKQQQEIIEKKQSESATSGKVPLDLRLERAGLNWSLRQFVMFSVLAGLVMMLAVMLAGGPFFAAASAGIVGALGLPRWFVGFRQKQRLKKFLEEYPNALDVIVRGMKAGLPLNDCVGIISREAAEPVASEFKKLVEAQQVGVPLHEGVARMYRRVPLSEVSFLSIMLAIQGQSGGNVAEPLSNLSKVVRDRKKLKAKITALSQEAKSSALIIACLPPGVMILVYMTTPEYIMLLFTEQLGNIMLGGCVMLMLIGVLIMRKMINFDF